MNRIAPYYKAVAGLLVPFLGAIIAALLPDSVGGDNITTGEWLSAIVVALVSGGAVLGIENKPKAPTTPTTNGGTP